MIKKITLPLLAIATLLYTCVAPADPFFPYTPPPPPVSVSNNFDIYSNDPVPLQDSQTIEDKIKDLLKTKKESIANSVPTLTWPAGTIIGNNEDSYQPKRVPTLMAAPEPVLTAPPTPTITAPTKPTPQGIQY